MLTKDTKPEVEDGGKAAKEVIPPRPDTPKMFKAALKVTEQVGIEGTFAKLRGTYRPADGSEVSSNLERMFILVVILGSPMSRTHL